MKKVNLSIGLAAFNEEANISWMLSSVLKQKEISFKIQEIIIYSDGSTDKTVEFIKSFKDKRIITVNSPKRLGKPSRLNQIFKNFSGDYLLLTDADVKFSDSLVIERLIIKAKSDFSLSLIMAKIYPFEGSRLLEKAAFNFFTARENVKNGYDYTKTVYAARGAGMLLSKKFAKSLSLPVKILNDDAYIYLAARSKNLGISFVRNAVILYKSVDNIFEYRKQFERYLDGEKQLRTYFSSALIKTEYRAPKKLLLRIMFKQIRTNPLAYVLLRLINSYCHYDLKFRNQITSIKWSTATSSKTLMIGQMIENTRGNI